MIFHCYPAYLKNSTSSYLLNLLSKFKMDNHLSTYFNNLCILTESIACCLFLTVGIPYQWIFIYLCLLLQKVLIKLCILQRNFTNKLPFSQMLPSTGFSDLIRFLQYIPPMRKGSLWIDTFPPVCCVITVHFCSQKN